ncbi:MLO-like protein 3 [Corylus avellana]|uniref:MLO-like protein 3 n=1 Tax=Corylus avellana TaxID=13451 RepID=UPI00286C9042|nr:MLO-like protein 3 [Corylus avellana]
MAAEGGGSTFAHSLQDTPVWALATVCFFFIFVSLLLEHLIHLLSNWLKRHRKTALFEAVERLKSVLILLGFISLMLAVTQRPISKICISTKVAYTMLPCHKSAATLTSERRLAAAETTNASDHCASQGKTSFISQDGILQLNNFIFVLAVMQIIYSVLTMALGTAKMRRWEAWEKETQTVEYQVANDPNRFRYTRQTTFGRRHMNSFTTTTLHLWIKCFFRQFFRSVAKVDYLTLRHGFISAHLSTNTSFNFQKYIQRSLEDDFKAVVGISPLMWFLVVIFLLVDVHGWHVYFWVSFLPLMIVLALGTKLEVIVATMALQVQDQNSTVIKGAPVVQPNDDLFWFNHPKFVLTLLHYTLFMNAFELSFFVWVTWQYGIKSCYHQSVGFIIIRVVLAVTVQVLCSYITLPLYALVTQMGSQFKSAALEEQTVHVVKQWYAETRDKRKKKQDQSSTVSSSNRTMGSSDFSSHHRILTFSQEMTHPSSEIGNVEEGDQEIHQDELELGMVSSNIAHIELSEVTKI